MSRSKLTPTTLDHPPFSLLTWNRRGWTGSVAADSWKEYLDSEICQDVTIPFFVESPASHNSSKQPPSLEQAHSFMTWRDNESLIHERVIQWVMDYYNSMPSGWLNDGFGLHDALPESIQSPESLRPWIRLRSVSIFSHAKDDESYLGFAFGCEWDVEHGLGVLIHHTNVVSIGDINALCPPDHPLPM